jgi:hypothetical protein
MEETMTDAVKELCRLALNTADALDVYTDSVGRPPFTQEVRAAVEAVRAEEKPQPECMSILSMEQLDTALVSLSLEQRIAVKSQLLRVGMLPIHQNVEKPHDLDDWIRGTTEDAHEEMESGEFDTDS